MISILLSLAQASTGALPSPEIAEHQAPEKPAAADDIIVTARPGEHKSRLGPVLPETRGDYFPRARLDLGNGAGLTADVSTHPREGVAQLGVTLKVPF